MARVYIRILASLFALAVLARTVLGAYYIYRESYLPEKQRTQEVKNLLSTKPRWYVSLQTFGMAGAITSSARGALPATRAPEELKGTKWESVSTVLVFEDVADCELYYRIYVDHSLRDGLMLGDHQVHILTPETIGDVFMIQPKTRKDVMLVPIPVFHEDAQEFLDQFIRSTSPREVGAAVAFITKKNAVRTVRG